MKDKLNKRLNQLSRLELYKEDRGNLENIKLQLNKNLTKNELFEIEFDIDLLEEKIYKDYNP